MSSAWNSLDPTQQALWSHARSANIYICPLIKYNDVQPELFHSLEGDAYSLYEFKTICDICREIVGGVADVKSLLTAYNDLVGVQIEAPTSCSEIKLVHPRRLSAFKEFLNDRANLSWSIGLGFFEPPAYTCGTCGNSQASDQIRCPNLKCNADRVPSTGQRDWTPELNLIARLELEDSQSAQNLLEFIEAYRAEAIQHSVFVVLSDDSIWQVCENAVIQKARVKKWLLHDSGHRTWAEQVQLIQRSMAFLNNERFRIEQNQADGGLGATFLPGDGGCLEVHVSGRARYLFEASFPPILARYSQTIERNKQPLLLVDVSDLNKELHTREVKYAVYESRRGDPLHCYCGLCYPLRTAQICQNIDIPVPRLRGLASKWINEKYLLSENLKTAWPRLSSPHFYFSQQPPITREADAAAAEQAKREWERLLEDELCK